MTLSISLFPRAISKLPIFRSSEIAECGLACIGMVAAYYGRDVNMNGLRQRFHASMSGTSVRGLMNLADACGLESRALRLELNELQELRLPAVIHWDLTHFVVLTSVSRNSYVIHDPGEGKKKLKLEEMSRHFTGVALEFTPVIGFEKFRARSDFSLSSLWSTFRGGRRAVINVLFLTLALQIVAFVVPLQIQFAMDAGVQRQDMSILTLIAVGFGALVLLQATVEAARDWALQAYGQTMTYQIVGNIIHHLLRLPVSYFERRHVGDVMSRISSAMSVQDLLTRGLIIAIIDGMMAIFACFLLFLYDTLMAMVVICSLGLVFAVMMGLAPIIRRQQMEQIEKSASEQSHLLESIRSVSVIKLMGREAEREGIWKNLYGDVVNATLNIGRAQISLHFAQQVITGIQTVAVIYIGATRVLSGSGLTIGMLYAFLSYRQTFSDRALGIINQLVQFRLLGLHVDRLSDIATARAEPMDAVAEPLPNKFGDITLTDVEFRYGTTDRAVLEDVNVAISEGDFVAISGPSGGGKSTLMKLMLGLEVPTSGLVQLDGIDASPALWRHWRKSIGVVMQTDQLVSGSIVENISFFDPEVDLDNVVRAARHARIHDDIMRMPMQYRSLIGDMGASLSGGQRQRLLIARALYRDPKVLFLDEGTANLDVITEEALAQMLSELPITKIVIAHRPALLRHCTKSFVVDAGKVIQQSFT